jgi:hypothetical protein
MRLLLDTWSFLIIAVLCQQAVADALGACYRGDIHEAQKSVWTACTSETPFSMCLRTEQLGVAGPDVACLANGLSLAIDGVGTKRYWRNGCTDPTWSSPYCLKAFDACDIVNAQVRNAVPVGEC